MKTNTETNNAPAWVMDSAEHGRLIKSAQRNGRAFERDVHKAAVAALWQCSLGNGSWMAALLEALPGVAKARDLAAWALAHSDGKLVIKTNGVKAKVIFIKGWLEGDFDIPLANGTPFWLFKPAKGEKEPLSLSELHDWLLKRSTGKVPAAPGVAALCGKMREMAEQAVMAERGYIKAPVAAILTPAGRADADADAGAKPAQLQ